MNQQQVFISTISSSY
ncbi:UNVERIFIED_CONTAM: hypothetical protein GTU68_043304 [Idotea baltica]|nr:hypothetical protein [Idotea baltica]